MTMHKRMLPILVVLAAVVPLAAQTTSSLPEPAPTAGPSAWSEDPIRYDGAGNVVTIGNQPFLYDMTGRLTFATITRPDQPGSQTQQYTYDVYGNMTTRTTNSVQTVLATDSATNHLYGPTYDTAGNITQWQPPGAAHSYSYTYDAFNMITEETTTATGGSHTIHVYTADDERIWSYDLNTNVSHWTVRDLGGKVMRDYQVNGSTWQIARDYFYRDGALLAAITPTRTEHYSLDHLGTPRVITDASGYRIGFHHYYPFGEEWTDASGAQEGNPLKFTGHERDGDLASSVYGLDYMHARYYSAMLGRFLSVDRISGSVARPQSFGLYTYVGGNPLTFTDPFGLMRCEDNRCVEEITVTGNYVDYDPEDLRMSEEWASRRASLATLQQFLHHPSIATARAVMDDPLASQMADIPDEAVVIIGTGVAVQGIALTGTTGGSLTNAADDVVVVSRWGKPGLEAGDWVMKGRASWWNYFWSGKWQPGFGNQFARFASGRTYVVLKSALRWPASWEIIKGILGQRQYRP